MWVSFWAKPNIRCCRVEPVFSVVLPVVVIFTHRECGGNAADRSAEMVVDRVAKVEMPTRTLHCQPPLHLKLPTLRTLGWAFEGDVS
jgi:hypothetical protein